jgi:hypothetical protein
MDKTMDKKLKKNIIEAIDLQDKIIYFQKMDEIYLKRISALSKLDLTDDVKQELENTKCRKSENRESLLSIEKERDFLINKIVLRKDELDQQVLELLEIDKEGEK